MQYAVIQCVIHAYKIQFHGFMNMIKKHFFFLQLQAEGAVCCSQNEKWHRGFNTLTSAYEVEKHYICVFTVYRCSELAGTDIKAIKPETSSIRSAATAAGNVLSWFLKPGARCTQRMHVAFSTKELGFI